MASPTDPTAAVVDASAAVAYCAREANRYAAIEQYLDAGEVSKLRLYAPGLLVGECLHVFCKKEQRGEIDAAGHAAAVVALDELMKSLNPPAGGDGALVLPAARLSAGYTCSKSNDSVYLALAEQLAADGEVVQVVTFDDDQARRAGRITGVTGRLLPTT